MKKLTFLFFLIANHFVVFSQSFVPSDPDTARIFYNEIANDFAISISYLYLIEYYKPSGEKDSIIYYDWEDGICSFYQKFENNIEYTMNTCEEGKGLNERIVFPRMSDESAKQLIEKLYNEGDKKWVSPNEYYPDGAGCFIQFLQNKNNTRFFIYCGC